MRTRRVTDLDVALLRSLEVERSVVAASRSVGISRDRATYRLARLREAFGGPVVHSERGGRSHGGTHLTPLGDRIVRGGFDTVELLDARLPSTRLSRPNLLRGIYHASPAPQVDLGHGLRLRVAFRADEGEAVHLLLDPESVLVARGRFPSSARNLLRAVVERTVRPPGALGTTLRVRVGHHRLRVAVTDEPIRQLHLRAGAHVWLYVKATAVRRVAGPAPPPGRGRRATQG
jgi:molybdate transport repressor ModE-like protein/molybdopterin-binding protein